ncbi:YceI family protein [Pedobacter insulae]|uniref:Polyisoprenoid-binding protein YceI n=1 Tax=Pedobacter insulae TaxID=414048 RepID=A0A1I3AF80_9SPHI|nr:YceI family protein [Pedobacter insulae]SFH48506.1 Polyisoprenoid-binding protein YceI [Pedobacter insulae]
MINFIRRASMWALLVSSLAASAQQTYHLDTKKSKLFWKGTKKVGTKHFGFLLFNSGWIRTNAAGMLNDGVFSMNMKTITTTEHKNPAENEKINKELKGSSFFETSTYPAANITVHSIMPTAIASQYKVAGDLTIKKTKHPITFLATIKPSATGLTANASLTIDRVKWGIHETSQVSVTDQFFSNIKDKMIADEIPISLTLVFTRGK